MNEIFWAPVRRASRHFSHRHFLKLHKEIRAYLPRRAHKEYLRSWIVNHFLLGPRKRAHFERDHDCRLPGLINLSPTEKCNLRCTGCYAASYSREHEMTPSQMNDVILQAKKLGIYFIGFLGGEPLLRKDIFPIIERHKDMAFRISTNGTLLDDDIIHSLKRCGNLVVFFSLEGLEADTDAWRGSGIFLRIEEAMSTLKRERILFGFSVVFHRENFRTVISERFLDTMQEAGCKFGLFFPYGPIGENARFDLALSEEQIERLFTELTTLEDKYTMLLLKESYKAPRDTRNFRMEQGCRAGVTVHITPEGYVEPCNAIQFHAVNVFEEGLDAAFLSPFYRDITACVERNGRHCVGMFSPHEVLDIVRKHQAKNSYPQALKAYAAYEQFHRSRVREHIERGLHER